MALLTHYIIVYYTPVDQFNDHLFKHIHKCDLSDILHCHMNFRCQSIQNIREKRNDYQKRNHVWVDFEFFILCGVSYDKKNVIKVLEEILKEMNISFGITS